MAQGGETLQIIRGVTTLDITDMVNYALIEFDGFGMPPVRRLTQRGPLQNGDTDVGYRLEARTIMLAVAALSSSAAAFHAKREQLIGMMRPGSNTDVVGLLWTHADGTQRRIDTHFSGGLTMPSSEALKWNMKRVVYQLRASDPTWYDPAGASIQFAQTGGGTPFAIPVIVPMTFGASTLTGSQQITLSGNNAWITYPIITVVGPVTGLILTNTTTGEVLDFTGNSVGAGVTYTIDLRYGYKTVIDSTSTNRVNQLTSASNLATWHLEPGTNSISAYGTSITAATSIVVQYNQRYLGV